MKKLLSSDYDSTLNVIDYDIYFNLSAIRKFRNLGNIFLLNTGRPYNSIKKEIKKFNIPYDYLACNDGNILFDSNDHEIYINHINEHIDFKIDDNIKIKPFMHKDYIIEYQICLKKDQIEDFIQIKKICRDNNLGYYIFEQYGRYFIYVSNGLITKSIPVNMVSELENIDKCDIFTIGDNFNDLEMIRDYNGYTLPWASKEVKEMSNGTVLSVRSLVKKIVR